MKPKTGFHIHGPGQEAAYRRTGADVAVFLDVDMESYGDFLKNNYFSTGRRAYMRIYHPAIMEQPIHTWVDRCRQAVDTWGRWLSGIIVDNEPNLAREHGIAEDNSPGFWAAQAFWESEKGYKLIADWTNEFFSRWDGYFPIGGPALAPDHHDRLGYEVMAPIIPKYSFLVIHNYAKAGYTMDHLPKEWAFRDLQPGGAPSLFPEKPYLVSEFNIEFRPDLRRDMERVALEAVEAYRRWGSQKRCLGLCWFSLGSPDPPKERTWDASRNPHLLAAVQMMDKEIPEEEESPMQSLAERFPSQFAAWTAAGGDPEEAFRAYLMAIGVLPVTTENLAEMTDNMKSHIQELVQIALAVPKA